MTSITPPPAKRVRTPPAPLHSPGYDSNDARSPRRSSRLNARPVSNPSSEHQDMPSGTRSRVPHPQSARSMKFRRTSSQTFSPPSSPSSPSKSKSSSHRQPAGARAPPEDRTTARMDPFKTLLDKAAGKSDLDTVLPTPSKTPRKRNYPAESTVANAARVLFPSRPLNDADVMPSPRRQRKGKKHMAFSLESFAEECEKGEDIAIYTDSKERIPEVDESEDNPFITRQGGRRAKSEPSPVEKKTKTKYGMTKEIDEAVDNNEGMVYVFRGKKIFRRFDDGKDVPGEEDSEPGNQELLRLAGAKSKRPFTRKSIKPRRLFPEADTELGLDDVDEEAVTDIETKEPVSEVEDSLKSPVEPRHYHLSTPPPTKTRGKRTRSVVVDTPIIYQGEDGDPSSTSNGSSPTERSKRKKKGFEQLDVTSKRKGEPLEKNEGAGGKRTRSGMYDSA